MICQLTHLPLGAPESPWGRPPSHNQEERVWTKGRAWVQTHSLGVTLIGSVRLEGVCL